MVVSKSLATYICICAQTNWANIYFNYYQANGAERDRIQ